MATHSFTFPPAAHDGSRVFHVCWRIAADKRWDEVPSAAGWGLTRRERNGGEAEAGGSRTQAAAGGWRQEMPLARLGVKERVSQNTPETGSVSHN